MYPTVWGPSQDPILYLHRPIFLYGLCSTALSGKPPRQRSLPTGPAQQAVPSGYPRRRVLQHRRQCQQGPRLVHLCRLRSVLASARSPTLRGRRVRGRMVNTVYALDATTIDLCLSVFPWARFRQTKAAIQLHTLLDLRGSIPIFLHITDGKVHDVNSLDLLLPEAGAFYVMDREYLDCQRLSLPSMRRRLSSSFAPNPSCSSDACIRMPSTRLPVLAARKRLSSRDCIRPNTIQRNCDESKTTMPPPKRPLSF